MVVYRLMCQGYFVGMLRGRELQVGDEVRMPHIEGKSYDHLKAYLPGIYTVERLRHDGMGMIAEVVLVEELPDFASEQAFLDFIHARDGA